MMTTKSPAELHIEIRAIRDAFVQKLTTALTAAGFKVSGTMPVKDWATGVLTVHSDAVETFDAYFSFDTVSSGHWANSVPEKVRLACAYGGLYRRKTRYTKLDDALIVKLVEDTKAYLKDVLHGIELSRQRETDQQRWLSIRSEQLAGVVVPPGTEIKIVMGDGPGAGTYRVEFEQHSVRDSLLTAEQVKKLVAVLNEIQGTATGWVIAATHGGNGRTYTYGSGGYWNEGGPKLFISEDEANAHLEKATKEFAHGQNVRVLPYASIATI